MINNIIYPCKFSAEVRTDTLARQGTTGEKTPTYTGEQTPTQWPPFTSLIAV